MYLENKRDRQRYAEFVVRIIYEIKVYRHSEEKGENVD